MVLGRSARRGLLLVGLVIFGLTTARYVRYRVTHRQFDAAEWQRMAEDLLRRGLLLGLSRDSVEGLLGPVNSTEHFRDWDFVYWLGPERSWISIDSEWLIIRLDANGRVAKAELTTD
jgi:hypothetical protein